MKAARFDADDSTVSIEDVEIPSVGPDEVRVDLQAASLCGSDVHFFHGTLPEPTVNPVTMGHEGAGVVDAVGDNVEHVSVGEQVAIHYVDSCGTCKPCLQGHDQRCRNRRHFGDHRHGTFAEFVTIPGENALPIADHVPIEWVSISACAVATPYHAAVRSQVENGDTVVVFGIGGIGLHAVLWANYFGAGEVIAVDINNRNLAGADEYGADLLVNAKEEDPVDVIKEHTDGWGADVVLECSGSEVAMEQAFESIKGRHRFATGNVVLVGIQDNPIPSVDFMGLREGYLTVSGDHTRNELRQIVTLLEGEKIDLSSSITHRFPLSEIRTAVDTLEHGEERVGRIVLDPT